ncbi:hypothetical protein VBY75_11790 [Idiomarina sp. HB]|uniref:hypothetical protein n=1 Tax=Idiomarina sp. HB TaxID=3110479 RepID=UPI003A80B400
MMTGRVSDWIKNFDVEDIASSSWLMNYFNDRRAGYVTRTNVSKHQSLKEHIINLYERDDDADFKFLSNMKAAYRQFEKRRNRGEKISRTYEISVASDSQLNTLSSETEVSKNEIIDTLIRESANTFALFSNKKKHRKKLTVKDILSPFGKEMGVGDFVFGNKTFPDEISLGKKISVFIDKLNKQANANNGEVNPLQHEDVLTLMIREGILHNINKSIASRSAPGMYGRKLTTEETRRTIDDLRIDDVFSLEMRTASKLEKYRYKFEKANQKRPGSSPVGEDQIIDKLVTDALQNPGLNSRVKNLEDKLAELSSANRDLEHELSLKLKDLKFEDEDMERQRAIIEALGEFALSLMEERNKVQNEMINIRLTQIEGGARRIPSRFEYEELRSSIESFKNMIKRAQIGHVTPDEIASTKLAGPEMPTKDS